MRPAILLLACAACSDNAITMQPVIDVPVNDGASAFPLDQVNVEIAHDGDTLDLSSAKFTKGQTISVGGVPFADDIVVHITGFVGSSEVAYGRTCAVAVTADGPPPAPHLYLSRSVKFGQVATAMPPELRVAGTAITYHDGSGLFVGGQNPNSNQPLADVEAFDPRTGLMTVLANNLTPRVGAVIAPLGVGADAQVAVIGGADITGAGAMVVELIEADQPESRRVQMVSDGTMNRVGLTATPLTDGRVIVIGGRQPPAMPPQGDVDEVTADSGTAIVTLTRAVLAHPRYGHTATRLSDDVGANVLIAGGIDDTGMPVGQAELYKPLGEAFSPTFSASMQHPRYQHHAVRMPDGSVLIIGGYDQNGPVPYLELFTLDGGFVELPTPLPTSAGVVDFTATPLPNGTVLIAGGLDASGMPTNAAFIARLDPRNGAVDVIGTDPMSSARAGHQATLLCDGTVLITGGTSDPVPAERYNPPPDGRR